MARPLKDIMASTYFGSLFRADKPIFFAVLLFFVLSAAANMIKLQTSPFFIWDMYSRKADPANTYRFLEIQYNDNRVMNLRHSWNEPEKTILNMPLKNYLVIRANNSIDPYGVYLRSHWLKKHPAFAGIVGQLYNGPAELDEFPAWFRRWLSAQVGSPVRNIRILEKKLEYEKDGGLREISCDTVLVIQ